MEWAAPKIFQNSTVKREEGTRCLHTPFGIVHGTIHLLGMGPAPSVQPIAKAGEQSHPESENLVHTACDDSLGIYGSSGDSPV